MKKALNKEKFKMVKEYLSDFYELSAEDIFNKRAYKDIKKILVSPKHFKILFSKLNNFNKDLVLKTYFPNKSGTLSENYKIIDGGYKNEKIFIIVDDNGNHRTFLLKVNSLKKIKNEVDETLKKISDMVGPLYGFFYNEAGYITDMNLCQGSYRIFDKNLDNYIIEE